VKSSSPIGIENNKATGKGFIALLLLSLICCLAILFWFISASHIDPFSQASKNLKGSTERGASLFRMNCVGCHGISAQGLVGPDLHGVTSRHNDKKIINQIIKGLTPPMPSFEMDPQSMADLLSYLHSLS